MFNHTFRNTSTQLIRHLATIKPKVQLDPTVSSELDSEAYKPRHHPGRVTLPTVTIPKHLVTSIENVTADYPIKILMNESKSLEKVLLHRRRPLESSELTNLKKKLTQNVATKYDDENLTEQQVQSINDSVKRKLFNEMHDRTSIQYNVNTSLLYLLARFAPEYAALVQIFSEIAARDPNFNPRSLFDFGSGTGTVSWAAKHVWDKQLYEFFNVDSSLEMNDLAQLLIQGGRANNKTNFKGIFFRQFLPASHIAYDLVVCAYTLLDLPSRNARLQTLLNLWNKCAYYMVLVERGTRSSFEIINEARSFLLNLKNRQAHVFSPCPHEAECPRFLSDDRCIFEVAYYSLPIKSTSQVCREKYSYVVLKKAVRDQEHTNWPRLVESPLIRSRHVICRMCTEQGKLQEVIISPGKHGKIAHRCAKGSKWGDRLPINIMSEPVS